MRALVLKAGLRFVSDVPEPNPASGEALLRILKAGICNTDLELVKGYQDFSGILGHEFVAEVIRGSSHLVGKRVVGVINISDGTCEFCQKGIPSQCTNRVAIGIQGHDGAFADYLALPETNLHVVPDVIDDESAVFVEPLAAALQILEAVHVSPTDRVVVLGVGKLGMLAAQVLGLVGADLVAVIRRESQARLLGSWSIPYAEINELQAHSADIVVDCTGSPEGFAKSLDLVKARGTLVLKSTYEAMLTANMTQVAVNEVRVVGSRCGPFAAALRLLQRGLVDVRSLVEVRYSIDDGLKAFEHATRHGAMKVLLEIN